MKTLSQIDFLPLFRSWFEMTGFAPRTGPAGLVASGENLLKDFDLEPMLELEDRLLNHAPSSALEAACLLEVVRQNIGDAGRSDGLDLRAIEAVQAWLAQAPAGVGGGKAVEQLLGRAFG